MKLFVPSLRSAPSLCPPPPPFLFLSFGRTPPLCYSSFLLRLQGIAPLLLCSILGPFPSPYSLPLRLLVEGAPRAWFVLPESYFRRTFFFSRAGSLPRSTFAESTPDLSPGPRFFSRVIPSFLSLGLSAPSQVSSFNSERSFCPRWEIILLDHLGLLVMGDSFLRP